MLFPKSLWFTLPCMPRVSLQHIILDDDSVPVGIPFSEVLWRDGIKPYLVDFVRIQAISYSSPYMLSVWLDYSYKFS